MNTVVVKPVVVVVFFTLTDRASTIPSNILRGCQYGTWSQRGTEVNGSHHSENPLLRPTGIQIATKSYATLQAMAPTSIKTVHQTSLLHIESSLDRLGFLKKNLNASRPSEHPPVRRKNVKTFRWDHRLQIQNLLMAFKRVPRW